MNKPFQLLFRFFALLILMAAFPLISSVAAEPAQSGDGFSPSLNKNEKITIELKAVNVLDVLDFLSKESGLNIVASSNVQGQVTIFLKDLEVREALRTVLEATGLAMIEEDGVIKIMTSQEYMTRAGRQFNDRRVLRSFVLHHAKAERVAQMLDLIKSETGKVSAEMRSNSVTVLDFPEILESMEITLAEIDIPSETINFKLKYTKAEEIEPKIRPLLTPETGSLSIDIRSNRVVISDVPKVMTLIKKTIESFDVQPPQVLIEARIVQVELNDNARYGVNWSYIANHVGSLNTVNIQPDYSVSAPTGGTLTTFTLGAGEDDLQVAVQMLEQFGKTNTLSAPRMTVLDNEEAKLAVATQEPFVTQTTVQGDSTSTVADNVQFIDIGVTMNVTPKITEDGFIVMKIKPEVSTQGDPVELQGAASGSDELFTRTRIPVKTTQEFETTVIVKDKHTIVVGGLIQDTEQKSMQKFPILGDLPILGTMFRSKTHNFSKTELIVFLTPKIIKGDSDPVEYSRFINQRGQMESFDRVGGYPFDKGIYQSQGPIRSDDVPYWQRQKGDVSEWFPPENLNTRTYDPYAPAFKDQSPVPETTKVQKKSP